MKRILQEDKIPAVIDSGDLLNFGSVTEAELAGLFTAIKDLRVPYTFVRGNHNASSLTDQSLLERMNLVPNVVLLEPTPQTYTELGVNEGPLAGFNDPRFFDGDSKNIAHQEQPAADAFNRAYAGRPRPDSVITHEPALAAMTPVERKILRSYAKPRPDGEEGWTPFVAALFVGLVAELDHIQRRETIAKMNEVTILHAHYLDHLADVAEAAEGADWSHVAPPEPHGRLVSRVRSRRPV
jgi:hypothetical protein